MGLFGRRKPQRRRVSIELEEYDWGKYTSGGVVVGESHHADDLAAIMASVRYAAAEHRRVSVCTTARLARDRGNEHDPSAVAVAVAEPPVVVGYINRKDAAAVAEAVEAPVQIRARLTKFRDGKFSVALDLAAWQALRGHEPDAHELPRRAPIRTRSSHDDVDEAVLAALAPKVPKAYCSAYRPDGDDEQREREGEDWERSKTLDGRLVATGHRLKRQALAVECRGKTVAYVMPVAMKLDPGASDGTPVKVKITASGWCSYDGEPHTPGASSLVDDDTAEEVCTRDFRVAVWKA